MSYRVFWAPGAEEQLEALLKAAPDSAAITAAVKAIDKALISSAKTFGESRYADMRIGFAKPLAVQFEVMSDVKTAIVHDVWRTDRA